MGVIGTPQDVLEQLVNHRTSIAMAMGHYATASDSVLAWFAAGAPTTPEALANLGPPTKDACDAVLTLEQLFTDVANSIRAAQAPAIPATVGAQAVRA